MKQFTVCQNVLANNRRILFPEVKKSEVLGTADGNGDCDEYTGNGGGIPAGDGEIIKAVRL